MVGLLATSFRMSLATATSSGSEGAYALAGMGTVYSASARCAPFLIALTETLDVIASVDASIASPA